jgi:SOS-response transcriptional repressor LexA
MKNPNKLSHILKRLLFLNGLRVTDLSKLTRVSQPTLQRMITGGIEKPHNSSLEPLAEYFNLTIEQLTGLVPIDWLFFENSIEMGCTKVPLLQWNDICQYLELSEEFSNKTVHFKTIITDANLNRMAFAITLDNSSMEPIFPKGTILIVDPTKQIYDRGYVLVMLNGQSDNIVFKQLLIDGKDKFLKSLNPELKNFMISSLSDNDRILGVLAQSKMDFI